jgi:hypothetical protein
VAATSFGISIVVVNEVASGARSLGMRANSKMSPYAVPRRAAMIVEEDQSTDYCGDSVIAWTSYEK